MGRLLALVCSIVLVDTAFYAVVTPLLPELEEELGLSKGEAGVLLGSYAVGTLVAALPAGLIAARVGPRRVVLGGLALLAGSCAAFAVLEDLVLLDAARFLQGVGGACTWAGSLAWLIEMAPPERRGELIGTALGAAIGGALLGPVIGGLASAIGFEPVFLSVSVLAGALAAWALQVPGPPAGAADGGLAALRSALGAAPVVAAMWLVALPAAAFGVLDTLVPLHMDDLGASGTAVAAAFLVAAGAEAVVSPIVGRISDRRGRWLPVRGGLLAAMILLAVQFTPQHALLVAAVLVVTTMALGTFWAPSMAMLSDEASSRGLHQGLAFALVNLAWAGGMSVGAAAGGALAGATADAVPYLLTAGLCAVTLAASGRVARVAV